MAHYQRLSLMEREELSRMLATGHSLRAVAQAIQRAPRTLSRELPAIGRRRPPIARYPPTNGRSVELISHANHARSLSTRACVPPSCICSRTAGLPNRLRTACRSGILTTRRCASRMKPSIPICMCCPAAP
ncbi:MAG: helix-turn-helix domain-containing protein [Nitrospira sp. CG24C]|nr:MAG: helix-turn-helix domain-containing protein [Nitrospira sp. CG24C]